MFLFPHFCGASKWCVLIPFHVIGTFLYPPRTLENLWFYNVFRVYIERTVIQNGITDRNLIKVSKKMSEQALFIVLAVAVFLLTFSVKDPCLEKTQCALPEPQNECLSSPQENDLVKFLCPQNFKYLFCLNSHNIRSKIRR